MFDFKKILLILPLLLCCLHGEAKPVTFDGELIGKKISTTDPFGLLPKNQFQVLIIDQVPAKTSQKSRVAWLQDALSLKVIQTALKLNVPLVTGEIPQGTTADAFVLPSSYQMTVDVLEARKDKTHHNILFIQSTATVDTISHELQHWQDYESGLIAEFLKRLEALQKTAKLTEDEFVKIQDAVVEIRGHARQEMVLMSNPKTNNPASLGYVEDLYSHYAENLIPILLRLQKKSPDQLQELLKLLAHYQLETQGHLMFTKLFANYYKS